MAVTAASQPRGPQVGRFDGTWTVTVRCPAHGGATGYTIRAVAQDETPQPYIVLVGINQYQDPQIKARKHAETDAQALYDLFISNEHLGVTPKNIKLLLGTPDKAEARSAVYAPRVALSFIVSVSLAGQGSKLTLQQRSATALRSPTGSVPC